MAIDMITQALAKEDGTLDRIMITVAGDAAELEALATSFLEAARETSPQGITLSARNGKPIRILIDRQGAASPRQ